MNNRHLKAIFLSGWLIQSFDTLAVDYTFGGIIDFRYSDINNTPSNNQIESFVSGDFGKFQYQEGSGLVLSQLATKLTIDWQESMSFHAITNGYWDDSKSSLGITEAFLKYNGLPSESGYKFNWRLGIMYPKISMENFALAWNSPYTLNYSTINSWIAEEVRHFGIEATISSLGKFNQSDNDLSATLSLFNNNDTSGALLAWHGWTVSSRQTLWQETIRLPNDSIRLPGAIIEGQNNYSDPFVEVDDRLGVHLSGEWRWKRKSKLLLGIYNNRAQPFVLKNGQYGWHTQFNHIGFNWKFDNKLTLIAQYLRGDTLMQSKYREDVVANDFYSSYLLISKSWQVHRLTARIESFSVSDKDTTVGDNNNESGESVTLSYQYRFNRRTYAHFEINHIDSSRPSRAYHGHPVDLKETQFQVAFRYFF